MKRLEVLGWWFNNEAPNGWPRPQLLVSRWDENERAAVQSYLRAGKTLVTYPETSFCRFACGELAMGDRDLTDGIFVWPDGLVHYVERHDVRLPQPFVAHVLAHDAKIAPFRLPTPSFGRFDTGPWLAWARAQRACLDLDGWAVPTPAVTARIAAVLGAVGHEAIVLCCGTTREVVLARGDGSLELHQLRPGGHAPQRLAGWHEWPLAARET